MANVSFQNEIYTGCTGFIRCTLVELARVSPLVGFYSKNLKIDVWPYRLRQPITELIWGSKL